MAIKAITQTPKTHWAYNYISGQGWVDWEEVSGGFSCMVEFPAANIDRTKITDIHMDITSTGSLGEEGEGYRYFWCGYVTDKELWPDNMSQVSVYLGYDNAYVGSVPFPDIDLSSSWFLVFEIDEGSISSGSFKINDLTIYYEETGSTLRYGVNGEWVNCNVYYGSDGEWVKVNPYYGSGSWIPCLGGG